MLVTIFGMAEPITLIELLRTAVQRLYKCEATHDETVLVEERHNGQIMWSGEVEVFVLKGHPSAKKCFAWMRQEKNKGFRPRLFLERWPVLTPAAAVRAAVALDLCMDPEGPNAGLRVD